MPAISPFSDQEWQRARDLVASGMEMPEVSQRTGIPYEGLRKRANREGWLIPSSAVALAKTLGKGETLKEECPEIVSAGAVLAESVAEMGEKSRIQALRGLLPVFAKTFSEGSELLSQPVDNWKNAGSMTNIVSKLAGWDKPQQAVQVNVWQQADERE